MFLLLCCSMIPLFLLVNNHLWCVEEGGGGIIFLRSYGYSRIFCSENEKTTLAGGFSKVS